MRLADTHAHLSDHKFEGDRREVLTRAREAGVRIIIDAGFDLGSSRRAVALADETEGVWAAVGIHPHDADTMNDASLAELRRLAQGPGVVAIGETGLDFYRDLSPRDQQSAAFEAHLALAEALGKPVIIHSRAAEPEVLACLRPWAGRVWAVLHCYSGDEVTLSRALDLGMYVSFAGPVTFANADRVRDLVRRVPLDRLLTETDSPYMAPVPRRGRRNEPAYVAHVVEAVAAVYDTSVPEMAEITFQNAEEFFGLGETSGHKRPV